MSITDYYKKLKNSQVEFIRKVSAGLGMSRATVYNRLAGDSWKPHEREAIKIIIQEINAEITA